MVYLDGRATPEPVALEFAATGDAGAPTSLWLTRAADVPLLLDDASGDVLLSSRRLRGEGVVDATGPDGTTRPIALKISRSYVGPGEWRTINPLESMTAEERRALRGVFIEDWLPELREQLADLDLERCVVAIERPLNPGANGLSTLRLPPNTRFLECRQRSWAPGERPWMAFVEELEELRYFKASLSAGFDPALLANAARLERLDLSGQVIENAALIGALSSLRHLDLAGAKGVDDLDFLRSLPELRSLDAAGLAPADISGLAGAMSLESAVLDASLAEEIARHAPAGLRRLTFIGAAPEQSAVIEALRSRAPNCSVEFVAPPAAAAESDELPAWLR